MVLEGQLTMNCGFLACLFSWMSFVWSDDMWNSVALGDLTSPFGEEAARNQLAGGFFLVFS